MCASTLQHIYHIFNSHNMQSAGYQLRQEIKKMGMTQVEAAQKLGIARETLISWMRRDSFSKNQIECIKEELGIIIQNPDNTDTMMNALEKGFAIKLLEQIQQGNIYPRQMVDRLKSDLAEAQKHIGELEEKIRWLEKK